VNRRFFLRLLPVAGALIGLKPLRPAELPSQPGYQFQSAQFLPPFDFQPDMDRAVREINTMLYRWILECIEQLELDRRFLSSDRWLIQTEFLTKEEFALRYLDSHTREK